MQADAEPDPHDIRPIEEIMSDMEDVAAACAGTPSDDALHRLFERALTAMLEIRVPRATSLEDVRRRLDEADPGDALPHDEVFDALEMHSIAFQRDLAEYRSLLARRDWSGAAAMLAEARPGGGWRVDPAIELDLANSQIPGAALLASVMQAHVRRPAIWRR